MHRLAQGATDADATAFGKRCQTQSKKRVARVTGTPFTKCVTAMSRLARAHSRSPQTACSTFSLKRPARSRTSPFDSCVAAGRELIKNGNGIDRSYVDEMIPHHQGAIAMSRVVFKKGVGQATRQLAEQITVAQTREIEQMRQFRASVTGSPAPAPVEGGEGHPH